MTKYKNYEEWKAAKLATPLTKKQKETLQWLKDNISTIPTHAGRDGSLVFFDGRKYHHFARFEEQGQNRRLHLP